MFSVTQLSKYLIFAHFLFLENVRFCSFSLSDMTVQLISLGSLLLVGQNKLFESITFASVKMLKINV